MFLVIFFSLLVLKLLKLCLLARICFSIQLCGVFRASVIYIETDKYLLYGIFVEFWCLPVEMHL